MGAVAGALAGSKAALGILPLGTLNHFARDLGIPFDLDEAARLIAAGQPAAGRCRARSTAALFVNNSAIGLYPLMVADREASRRSSAGASGWRCWSHRLRTLARFQHHRLTLTVNGRQARRSTRRCCSSATMTTGSSLPRRGHARIARPTGGSASWSCAAPAAPGFLAAMVRALAGRSPPDDMVQLEDVRNPDGRQRAAAALRRVDRRRDAAHAPAARLSESRQGGLKVIAP